MAEAELARAVEAAVLEYARRMPAREITGVGTLHVKVDLAPSRSPEDGYGGALFVSMPFVGADRDWMTKVMAHVRDGCERGEVTVEGYGLRLEEDEAPFGHNDDELRTQLLSMAAPLRLTRAE